MKYLILEKATSVTSLRILGEEAMLSDVRLESYSAVKTELRSATCSRYKLCRKTGRPNVDWCEDHKTETLFSNVTAPLIFPRATKN